MLRLRTRIIAFLLVPCLVSDPSFAALHSQNQFVGLPQRQSTQFNEQALSAPSVVSLKSFSGPVKVAAILFVMAGVIGVGHAMLRSSAQISPEHSMYASGWIVAVMSFLFRLRLRLVGRASAHADPIAEPVVAHNPVAPSAPENMSLEQVVATINSLPRANEINKGNQNWSDEFRIVEADLHEATKNRDRILSEFGSKSDFFDQRDLDARRFFFEKFDSVATTLSRAKLWSVPSPSAAQQIKNGYIILTRLTGEFEKRFNKAAKESVEWQSKLAAWKQAGTLKSEFENLKPEEKQALSGWLLPFLKEPWHYFADTLAEDFIIEVGAQAATPALLNYLPDRLMSSYTNSISIDTPPAAQSEERLYKSIQMIESVGLATSMPPKVQYGLLWVTNHPSARISSYARRLLMNHFRQEGNYEEDNYEKESMPHFDPTIWTSELETLGLIKFPYSDDEINIAWRATILKMVENAEGPDQVQARLKLTDEERERNPEYQNARERYQAINNARDILKLALQSALKRGWNANAPGTTDASPQQSKPTALLPEDLNAGRSQTPTLEEEQRFLDRLVAENRVRLLTATVETRGLSRKGQGILIEPEHPLSGANLKTFCDVAGLDLKLRALKLEAPGVLIREYFSRKLYDEKSVWSVPVLPHVFLVIEFQTSGRSYLVDTTFIQFFEKNRRYVSDSGGWKVEELGLMDLATELLEKGYLKISDDVAIMHSAALGKPPEKALELTADVYKSPSNNDTSQYVSASGSESQLSMLAPESSITPEALASIPNIVRNAMSLSGIDIEPLSAYPHAFSGGHLLHGWFSGPWAKLSLGLAAFWETGLPLLKLHHLLTATALPLQDLALLAAAGIVLLHFAFYLFSPENRKASNGAWDMIQRASRHAFFNRDVWAVFFLTLIGMLVVGDPGLLGLSSALKPVLITAFTLLHLWLNAHSVSGRWQLLEKVEFAA